MIALVGRPNSGKTTLFNWLTGSKFRTVNYPGATVDYSIGKTLEKYGDQIDVVDTPGIYSLDPQSADEQVTVKKVFEDGDISAAVVVIDGTQFKRQLPLLLQMQESELPLVLAITMEDLTSENQIQFKREKLEAILGAPVVFINGQLGGGVIELVEKVRGLSLADKNFRLPRPWNEQRYLAAQAQVDEILKTMEGSRKPLAELTFFARTRKWDQYLLHPVFGLGLFFVVMMTLFASVFWLADPLMGFVDEGFGILIGILSERFPETLWAQFLGDGVIASVGAVLVFVPQIFILFFGIGLLEDSGYLARAATLIDRPFSKVGLSGRSFVPMLSGFACAVPAMMATRSLSSRKERWIAIFILPLMTCSARLPVYALLLAFLFLGESAFWPGVVLAGLYFGSLILGAISAGILNRMLPKRSDTNLFLIELPFYRRPSFRVVFKSALNQTMGYVRRAGPIIFALSVVIWVGTTFPKVDGVEESARLEQSFMGQMGKTIEPIFEPMGADWRVGLGLMSAFAAREVFVSTMAIIFNVSEVDDESALTASMISKMKSATWSDGTQLFSVASVSAILIFFMIALQCLSTFAMAVKEMNSWKFAVIQLVALNLVAYVLAVGVYQIMS